MSPVTEESGNGGGVRYVGGESMQSGAPVVLPTVEEAPFPIQLGFICSKAEEKTDLYIKGHLIDSLTLAPREMRWVDDAE